MIDFRESWRVLKQHPGLGPAIAFIGFGGIAGADRGVHGWLIGSGIMSVFLLIVLATSIRRKP